MTNVQSYVNLVQEYEWSGNIEAIILTLKTEKRCAAMIANGIRNVGFKVELIVIGCEIVLIVYKPKIV